MDNRTLIQQPSGGERTQVVPPPATGAQTLMGVTLTCPVCTTQNAGGTEWCGECGFRLDATPGSTSTPDANSPLVTLTDDAGKTHALHQGVSTIGRQDTTVLLSDPTVSRRHAQITVEDSVWVEDLGSSNGTKVNGRRIQPGERVELQPGASLAIGAVSLAVEYDAARLDSEEDEPETEEPAAGEENLFQDADDAELELPEAEGEADEASLEPDTFAGPRLLLPDGKGFDLHEGTVTVGRRDANDVVLADSYISGAHAELIRSGDEVQLVDKNSTNGTLVNGDRLPPEEPILLHDGDAITFGQTRVLFSQVPGS